MNMTRTQQRLMMSASKSVDTGCWDWTGQVSNSGHGRITVKSGEGGLMMQSAEYASYEAFIGAVPDGMRVKQTCNNRLCINPDHLVLFDPVQVGADGIITPPTPAG